MLALCVYVRENLQCTSGRVGKRLRGCDSGGGENRVQMNWNPGYSVTDFF